MFDPTIASKHLGGGSCVISIAGEVDMYTAPRLERELLGAFGTGATTVVVDLTECELIDARGLSILAWAGRQLESAAGWLALVTDHRRIRKVFEITGLDAMLEIYPSRPPAATEPPHDARRETTLRQEPSGAWSTQASAPRRSREAPGAAAGRHLGLVAHPHLWGEERRSEGLPATAGGPDRLH